MKLIKLISLCLITLTLSSCSSYMSSIYKNFEQQERSNNEIDVGNDGFEQFRNKRHTSTEYNRTDRTVTTSNEKYRMPETKRQYKSEKESVRRHTASDLTDNGSDGSLWAGSDPNAFLFSNNKTKSSGDIVQISVLPRLKNEITLELKKAFPDNPYDAKAAAESAKTADSKAPPADKKEAASAESTADDMGQDKISGVVVEEINREHLLIKGRKNVLFKNRKRMVEIQALVSRKDIGDNDTVSSDAILESNVSVVR
jgi:flagellar L-ring protein precursor FlgH